MLSLVPLRAETSDRAEMVTQLTFGECYEVVGREGNWLHVQLAADGYRGWIDQKQHKGVTEQYFREWVAARHPRALDLVQAVQIGGLPVLIGMGSYLPFFDGQHIRIEAELIRYNGAASDLTVAATPAQVVQVAQTFIKAPYLWGGKSVFGIDCSGFVQQVYGMCGYRLPRDAYQQVAHGQEVHFATQTAPGDLAYFSNEEGRITHVGLLLEGQRIVHAHGEVRVDLLDHNGIYLFDWKRYSHKLRIIKRIFS